MAKLLFSMLMIVIWWMLHTLQLDEEIAMGTVHEAKRAVDRAAHAAAQQLDRDKLELGVLSIEATEAEEAVAEYLRNNLLLDHTFTPVPGSFLQHAVELRVLEVINEETVFPYIYRNPEYDYEVVLDRPGVVVIIHLQYPRLFGVLDPIEWDIRGTAQLVF